jgi:L-fucose isomerase-like protein
VPAVDRVRGVSLPGPITRARARIDRDGHPVMDLGRGESVALPQAVRESWWRGTTRQWPFMADLDYAMQTVMAHDLSSHIAAAYGDILGDMTASCRSRGLAVPVLSAS